MSHAGSDVGVRWSLEQEKTGVPREKPPETGRATTLPSHIRPFAESWIRSRIAEVRSECATTALTGP